MTVVDTDAWEAAGGHVIGTTTHRSTGEDPAIDRQLDDGSLTSVGELKLGKGAIRIVGGALPTPTEAHDHRFGLRNYGLTYSGLFLMENAIEHDAAGLGDAARPACLARRAPVGRRNIGRVRLGLSRSRLLLSPRLARVRPTTTHRKRYRYCVRRTQGQGHGRLRSPREGGADHHERVRPRQPPGAPGQQRPTAAPRLPGPQAHRSWPLPPGQARPPRGRGPQGQGALHRRSPAAACC